MPKIDQPATSCPPTPTKGTLRKYGMTEQDWQRLCAAQGCLCPVCSEPFGDRKLVIDHAHVRRFRKMRPEDKRRHVRGVLHSFCNRYVRGWLTLTRAKSILAYLEAHERRKAASENGKADARRRAEVLL